MSEISQAELSTEGQAASKNITSRGGVGLLVLAACLWGTTGVGSALLNRVEATPSLTVAFLRMGFAAPVLLMIAVALNRRNPFRAGWRDWGLCGLMGLAMATYQVAYFAAIPISSVTLVVVIALCSAPLMVALISIPVFGERLTGRLLVALGLGLTGTLLLVFGGNSRDIFRPEYLLGAGLALVTGLAYACFTILSKVSARRATQPGSQTVALAFSCAAVIVLLVAWPSGNLRLYLAPGVWAIGAYLGVVPTGLAYLLFLAALRSVSATTASIVTLLEPAVAAVLAALLLGEQLGPLSLIGAVLLVASVARLSR